MSDIFISYASADRPRVKPLVDALLQKGWSVWWDRSILAGKTFDRMIEEALGEARCVIVLWSRNSIASDWVKTEADDAKRRGLLVPVLLDDVTIPLEFRRVQTASLVNWSGVLASAAFDQLARAVTEVLSRSACAAEQPASELRHLPKTEQAILRGAGRIATAIKATFGPLGRQAIINRKQGDPILTSDARLIVRELELKDPLENIGAHMMRAVVGKLDLVAHGGCATGAILAHAIFREGIRQLASGAQPVPMGRGIQNAVQLVTAELKRLSRPVTGDTIAQVGAIAAKSDATIGNIIAEGMMKVGKDGVITVEESRTTSTELQTVDGMQFDRGYLSPRFVSDAGRMECVLEEPYILAHQEAIRAVEDLLPLLDRIARSGKPLLIIAEEVAGEALAALVSNKQRAAP